MQSLPSALDPERKDRPGVLPDSECDWCALPVPRAYVLTCQATDTQDWLSARQLVSMCTCNTMYMIL